MARKLGLGSSPCAFEDGMKLVKRNILGLRLE